MHTQASIANLHDLGFAVDFNATETPHLKDNRQKDLIQAVTGDVAWLKADTRWYATGQYDDMVKKTEQHGVMADPDPKSKLGQLLATVETEAKKLSERSEAFRGSVDANALLELRSKRRKWIKGEKDAAWGAEQQKALTTVIDPWIKKVDAELASNEKKLKDAGFDVATLKSGKDLDTEHAAVGKAAADAAKLRKGISGGVLSEAQRKQADTLIETMRKLFGIMGAAATPPLTDAERLKVLDGLIEAATKRLGGYGAAAWRARLKHLRTSLDDPGWVLGDTDWNPKEKRFKTQVGDPSPAQLADLGFFTLREHSRSAPGGKAQPGAFDIPFIKAMVKHGFHPLATSSDPDSMHFELRWTGPRGQRP